MNNPLPEGGPLRHINSQMRNDFLNADALKRDLEETKALLTTYTTAPGSTRPLDTVTYNKRILDAVTALSKNFNSLELNTLANRIIVETVEQRPQEIWQRIFGATPLAINTEEQSNLPAIDLLLKNYKELMRKLALSNIQDPKLNTILEKWQSSDQMLNPTQCLQDLHTVCLTVRDNLQKSGLYSEENMHVASEIEVSLAHLQAAAENYVSH
jgi:hypothetical protein